MKKLFTFALLLLTINYPDASRTLLLQTVELVSRHVPVVSQMTFNNIAGNQALSVSGKENQLAAELQETLVSLKAAGHLQKMRVSLKRVRFVPNRDKLTNVSDTSAASQQTTGFYEATIGYELLAPLTKEAGLSLVSAICGHGFGQVKLTDSYGVNKTFQCDHF